MSYGTISASGDEFDLVQHFGLIFSLLICLLHLLIVPLLLSVDLLLQVVEALLHVPRRPTWRLQSSHLRIPTSVGV